MYKPQEPVEAQEQESELTEENLESVAGGVTAGGCIRLPDSDVIQPIGPAIPLVRLA